MSAPTVSVVMPVYDGEAYLREALDSILGQTLDDLELVVVDDGSTDGTAAILDESAAADRRVRVFHEPHRGLVASLNLGLGATRGRYVARMDADDVSLPERLARQVAFMDEHPEVGVCGTWVDLGDGRIAATPTDDDAIRVFFLFDNLIAHPTVVMRRSLLEESGARYPDVPHAEDYALWTALAARTRFAVLPEPLLRYRQHPAKVGHRHWVAQREAVMQIRLAQLAQLGLVPTEEQAGLHQRIAEGSDNVDRAFLDSADRWLRTLAAANEQHGTYPEPAFRKALAERWMHLCGGAIEQVGASAAVAYYRSPLSREPSLGRRLRLEPAAATVYHWLGKPDLKRRARRVLERS